MKYATFRYDTAEVENGLKSIPVTHSAPTIFEFLFGGARNIRGAHPLFKKNPPLICIDHGERDWTKEKNNGLWKKLYNICY